MRPRIQQNAWGNWYGYIGRKRVKAFSNPVPNYGAQQEAEQWFSDTLVLVERAKRYSTDPREQAEEFARLLTEGRQ